MNLVQVLPDYSQWVNYKIKTFGLSKLSKVVFIRCFNKKTNSLTIMLSGKIKMFILYVILNNSRECNMILYVPKIS